MSESYKEVFLRNYANIIFDLLHCSVDVAFFIACQFALESSFGTSAIAKENFNLCGMRVPAIRPTTCIGVNRAHAKYADYLHCCIDYCLWLSYNAFSQKILSDVDKFRDKLFTSGYCPETGYSGRIMSIYNQFYSLCQMK